MEYSSFSFIFNKKLNSKALLVSVISSVALFAVGIGLSFYEVVNTTYIISIIYLHIIASPSPNGEISLSNNHSPTSSTNKTGNFNTFWQ